MKSAHIDRMDENRLQFIFNESVVSFVTTYGLTLSDIAETLGELPKARHGRPVAIALTFGRKYSHRGHPQPSAHVG
jgi:hypothetical protein